MMEKKVIGLEKTEQGDMVGAISFKNDIALGISEILLMFAELPRLKKLRIVMDYDPEAVNATIKVYQQ